MSRLWFHALQLGVEGGELGVEQSEERAEPELGLPLTASGEKRASLRSPLLFSSACRYSRISLAKRSTSASSSRTRQHRS